MNVMLYQPALVAPGAVAAAAAAAAYSSSEAEACYENVVLESSCELILKFVKLSFVIVSIHRS